MSKNVNQLVTKNLGANPLGGEANTGGATVVAANTPPDVLARRAAAQAVVQKQKNIQALLQRAKFWTSAAKNGQFPAQSGAQIAFVGRSNAGKSSAINRLCAQGRLAYTSKTPGRTQLVNFFSLAKTEDEREIAPCLVDLPGYGFAQVPLAEQNRWQFMVADYFAQSSRLALVVLVMDARHPFTDNDIRLLTWLHQQENLSQRDVPILALLTKADKLRYQQKIALQNQAVQIITPPNHSPTYPLLRDYALFSATHGQGIEDVQHKLFAALNKPMNKDADEPH